MKNKDWLYETLYDDYMVGYKIKDSLDDEKTPFQSLDVVDTHRFGKMLVLDGVVQTTEKDEFVYHEMMSHVALLAHPNPKNVLIIGGGDGGILREVLKHPKVKKATMVEIDGQVVEFSKKHLKKICKNAFKDSRTELVIDDGAKFVKSTKDKFDVIIVDSCDPIGPATVLFTKKFYGDIKNILKPKGILIRQSGSSYMQKSELKNAMKFLKSVFKYNAPCLFNVPTYAGGLFTLTFSSDEIDPLTTKEANIEKKFSKLDLKTQYYNPGIHVGSLKIPEYVKKLI